ncbi:MAG: flagellar hook-length control protein FliK, partial [Phenylobacterium sp.]|nr:flagellar hook-length control protein FliK [Phenylobacterium sp.]
ANTAAAGNDAPDAAEAAALDAGPAVETSDSTPAVEARAASHTESSSATPSTTAPVRGSPETVAALAAQIIKKLEGRSTRFDVELNPDGLGKVDVRIEIGAQGRMTASLTFDNAQAAQDLKARANDLQRAMEQAGFDMSGGFSFDLAQDHGRQHQGWQDARPEMSDSFRGKAFRAALETAGDAADAAAQGALQLRRGVNAGLDLRI